MMSLRIFRWTMVTSRIDPAHPAAKKDVGCISAMTIGNRMMRIMKRANKASADDDGVWFSDRRRGHFYSNTAWTMTKTLMPGLTL